MKNYRYDITLRQTPPESGDEPRTLGFSFENHDDIFCIISHFEKGVELSDPQQVTQLAVGLKLFSDIMLRNRGTEPFASFEPAFRNFMETLKGLPKD